MTPSEKRERLAEIKNRLNAFKHWHEVNPSIQMTTYQETHGPDLEFVIQELEAAWSDIEEAKEVVEDNYYAAKRERERGDFYKAKAESAQKQLEKMAGALKNARAIIGGEFGGIDQDILDKALAEYNAWKSKEG